MAPGWPSRGRSLTVSVCWNRCWRRIMVCLWQLFSCDNFRKHTSGCKHGYCFRPFVLYLSRQVGKTRNFILCCFFNMPITRANIPHSWNTRLKIFRAPRVIYAKQPHARLDIHLINTPFVFWPRWWHYAHMYTLITKKFAKRA